MLKLDFCTVNQSIRDTILNSLWPGFTLDDGDFKEIVLYNNDEEIIKSYPNMDVGDPTILKLSVTPEDLDSYEGFKFAAVTFFSK